MPKFDKTESYEIPGGNSFNFSAIRPEDLTETEYTLVTIEVDVSGSVGSFKKELRQAIVDVVEACKKSPKSENLLIRVVVFNSGLSEVHGFKPLSAIDSSEYKLQCGGGTALFDATFDAIGSTLKYAEILTDQEFKANGIVFIITDGEDNASRVTPKIISDKITESLESEKIDSLNSILVGINTKVCGKYLDTFHKDATLKQYVDIGDASPGSLAKLAQFVSKSISSTSQVLGQGKPASTLIF